MRRSCAALASVLLFPACGPQELDLALAGAPVAERTPAPAPVLALHQPDAPDFVRPPAQQHAELVAPGTPRARVVYLAVDGVTVASGGWSDDNAQANTSFLVEDSVTLPAFEHEPWGDDRDVVLAELAGSLDARFAEFEVWFVTERPVAGDYTMMVLGGDGAPLGRPEGAAGVAPLDAGDRNANDVGFVFPSPLAEAGYDLEGLSAVVAHELGHTLGLRHIDRDADVMAPVACHCPAGWGTGAILDRELNPTSETQDDLAVLATVLLPRGEAGPVCPFDDAPEPDDDDDALPLQDGVPLDTLACADDDDRWVLDADVGCEVVAAVDFVHDDGNLSLRMERADGTPGARSFSRDDGERAVELVTDDGPPVARVYGYGDTENAYAVTLASHCPEDVGCQDGGDLHEPNDARGAEATRLYPPAAALGAVCGREDEDYFRFFVKKGCTASVDLSFVDDDGNLSLRLMRYDGTSVAWSFSVTDDEHATWTADRSTLLYARVYGYGAHNAYRLDVATTCPEP